MQSQIGIHSSIELSKLEEIRSQHKGVIGQISSQMGRGMLPSIEQFIPEGLPMDNENIIMAMPHVPEEILKQEMERDQDSINQDDSNE